MKFHGGWPVGVGLMVNCKVEYFMICGPQALCTFEVFSSSFSRLFWFYFWLEFMDVQMVSELEFRMKLISVINLEFYTTSQRISIFSVNRTRNWYAFWIKIYFIVFVLANISVFSSRFSCESESNSKRFSLYFCLLDVFFLHSSIRRSLLSEIQFTMLNYHWYDNIWSIESCKLFSFFFLPLLWFNDQHRDKSGHEFRLKHKSIA